jgi:hypothetical protein
MALAVGVICVAVALSPRSVHAWDFDPGSSCAVEEQRNFDLLQSQLYFMVDRSGSMARGAGEWGPRHLCTVDLKYQWWYKQEFCRTCRSESDCRTYFENQGWVVEDVIEYREIEYELSKWLTATNAIINTVQTLTYPSKEDLVQFGFGVFWTDSKNHVSPMEDSAGPIENAIYNESPVGGTRMDRGLDKAISTLNADPNASERPQATLLLTDGEPNRYSGDDTIQAACQHRNQVGPVHVVGFGSGTDERFNNLLAAAGGTGYCCTDGQTCNETTSNHVDPCGVSPPVDSWGNVDSNWECHGATQVSGGTALQAVATEIANDLSCQIDASSFWEQRWSEPGYGCASSDYSCLKFDWDGAFGGLSYNQNDSAGTGWRWLDPNQQETVVLNDQTCRDIEKPSTGNIVYVKRACICDAQTTGAECSRTNTSTCECLDGNVTCSQSSATCTPKTDCQNRDQTGLEMCSDGVGVCKVTTSEACTDTGDITCPATATAPPESPNETSCDNLDNDCDGQVDEDVYRSCDTGKQGRCAVGRQACSAGSFGSCVQQKRPVPEICNGLDDDCDGVVDNIMASWDKNWNVSLDTRTELACGQQYACTCPSASDIDSEYRGSIHDGTVDDEFDTMMQNTQTGCFCTE